MAASFETAALRPPQDEALRPHGEERGNAARLEPRGHGRTIRYAEIAGSPGWMACG